MFGGNDNTDKALQKAVTRRLQRASSQSGLAATVQNGSVTITGKLAYENQRLPVVKAMRSVAGIRNVIDQMQAPPKTRPQHQENSYRPPAAPVATPDVVVAPLAAISEGEAALPTPELSGPPSESLN
jgi:hypothetical protein